MLSLGEPLAIVTQSDAQGMVIEAWLLTFQLCTINKTINRNALATTHFLLWIQKEICEKDQWRVLYVFDEVMLPSCCVYFLLPLSTSYPPSYVSQVKFTHEIRKCPSEAETLKTG